MVTSEQPLNETYRRALEVAKQKSGKDRGAAAWLARYLGVERQLLFYWSRTGFPDEYVPAVAKLAQLDPDDVTTITIDMPKSAWPRFCDKKPKSLINQAVVRK